MAKEGFNWKNLFINENSEEKQPATVNQTQSSETPPAHFPTSTPVAETPVFNANPFMDEVIQVYEKGLDSLNLSEFDFFEVYKSVIAVGVSNPQSYQMAFTMGKSIKADLTKEFLLEKSKYYLTEIEKVHTQFDTTGKAKRNDLDMGLTRDKVNLTKEVSDLEAQIASLQATLSAKKEALAKIDQNSGGAFNEIDLKLQANDIAKKKIVDSINTVVIGITQYL